MPIYAVASIYGDSWRMPRKGFHTLRVRSVKSTRAAIAKIKRRPGEELLESSDELHVGQFLDTAYMPSSVTYLTNPRGGRSLGARRASRRTARGAHRKNPSLVTYLANSGRPIQIASDVQAVLYRHAKDGSYRVHVFGNQTEGDLVTSRGREYLRLDNLPARTGVILERIGKRLLVRHRNGKALARAFPD